MSNRPLLALIGAMGTMVAGGVAFASNATTFSDWVLRHWLTEPVALEPLPQQTRLLVEPAQPETTVKVENSADITFACQNAEMDKVTIGLSVYFDAVAKCVERSRRR